MDIRTSEMLEMQRELLEKNKDRWHPHTPEYGRDSILWMIEEIGEICSILKKRGEKDMMEDADVRGAFIEEMADVSMYFHKILLCYGVTAEEFSGVYEKKHRYNMGRDYEGQYERFLKGG